MLRPPYYHGNNPWWTSDIKQVWPQRSLARGMKEKFSPCRESKPGHTEPLDWPVKSCYSNTTLIVSPTMITDKGKGLCPWCTHKQNHVTEAYRSSRRTTDSIFTLGLNQAAIYTPCTLYQR
jgi:hypothetical protein